MGRIEPKSLEQVEWMRETGLVVVDIHRSLREAAHPRIMTHEPNAVPVQAIRRADIISNLLNYMGYPVTACISINDVVIHGIPGGRILEEGDPVSFDCGARVSRSGRERYGDAAFSMVVDDEWIPDEEFAQGKRAIGATSGGPSDERIRCRRELDTVTCESLWAAPANFEGVRCISAVGAVAEGMVTPNADELGWEAGIIEEYTGHDIGTAVYQGPEILNYDARRTSVKLKSGTVLAVKPMLTVDGTETFVEDDEWAVRTCDGSDAAYWEYTVTIFSEGISALTASDFGKAGLIPPGVVPVEL